MSRALRVSSLLVLTACVGGSFLACGSRTGLLAPDEEILDAAGDARDAGKDARDSGRDADAAEDALPTIDAEKDVIKPKYGLLGPQFKARSAQVGKALEGTDISHIRDGAVEVELEGERISIEQRYFDVVRVKEKVNGIKVVPHVIEPSHGLDRILYTCLEHAYSVREKDYVVLRLSLEAAPIKVGVFPLMSRDGLDQKAKELDRQLRRAGLVTFFDDSGSIGRRYARMDEVGTPFCITVDFDGLRDGTVTIRDRDSTKQIRVPSEGIAGTVEELLAGRQRLF